MFCIKHNGDECALSCAVVQAKNAGSARSQSEALCVVWQVDVRTT